MLKFLCDEMLQRLGSWLRAAGYDTLIEADGRDDYELLKQAIAEDRLLITRDRKIAEYRRAGDHVILLQSNSLEDCIAELSQKLNINWLYQPFFRCMVCNTPLKDASPEQVAALSTELRESVDAAYYCSHCNKMYWEGGHVQRMRERLNAWQTRYHVPVNENKA